MVKKM